MNESKYYILANGDLFGEHQNIVMSKDEGEWYLTFIKSGNRIPFLDDGKKCDNHVKSGEWIEVKLIPRTGFDIERV